MGVIGGGWMQWCVVTRSDTRKGLGGHGWSREDIHGEGRGVKRRDSYYMGVGRGFTGEQ